MGLKHFLISEAGDIPALEGYDVVGVWEAPSADQAIERCAAETGKKGCYLKAKEIAVHTW